MRSSSDNGNLINDAKRQHRNPPPSILDRNSGESSVAFPTPTEDTNFYASDIPSNPFTMKTPLEVDSEATAVELRLTSSASISWMDRLRRLQQAGPTNNITDDSNRNLRRGADFAPADYYYEMRDGIMKTTMTSATLQGLDHADQTSNSQQQQQPINPAIAYPLRKQPSSSSFSRVASWFAHHSHGMSSGDDDGSSLADFDESEWTPPDSSYGAAIPVAGWIPKPIRRMIEGTLIALGIVALVYMVVTTSMRVTNERSNKNDANRNSVDSYGNDSYLQNGKMYSDDNYYRYDGGVDLDDDLYVTYGQQKNYKSENDEEDEASIEDEDDDRGGRW